ncbi:NAD(P)-binding protein [Punctularia strigosozonata HHB-11173 SS5]|uniref:NAD(P)-binding protein n=1 Tax=Punctularia strigosozonata (strain HHB-11173) TaxID=741275 RepID=UPI0004416C47|nr:NAD(P)-binding protein [Punctularia strigosozonata HHB-11173 SS5]EIN12867.1 NAD(P)-binding protein [Punctularia strigosozonata HHB-11173 SS5]
MVIKVAIAGGTGVLGPFLVQGLAASGMDITVLTRKESVSGLPAAVSIRTVDYDSVESLTAALQGQDAVVSTLGRVATLKQKALADAAVAAGVKRFIPAEFGSDTLNPKVRTVPIQTDKVEVQNYLRDLSAKSELTYTLLITGPFLDGYIQHDYILGIGALKNRRAMLLDGGDIPFSATTVPHIAQSVAAILHHLEETKNRPVYVEDIVLTQNQVLRLAQELTLGGTWTIIPASTATLTAKAYELLERDGLTEEVVNNFIIVSHWAEGMSRKFSKTDNALLGIPSLSEEDVKAMIKKKLESL